MIRETNIEEDELKRKLKGERMRLFFASLLCVLFVVASLQLNSAYKSNFETTIS